MVKKNLRSLKKYIKLVPNLQSFTDINLFFFYIMPNHQNEHQFLKQNFLV